MSLAPTSNKWRRSFEPAFSEGWHNFGVSSYNGKPMTVPMSVRWVIGAAAALALSLASLGLPRTSLDANVPAGSVCEPGAKAAPMNFTLKNMENRDVRLADFKGKVILLNFWATWCGPCKLEIPLFVDFQSKYGKSGLQIVGISIDDTIDKLKPFALEFKMNYPVLQGRGYDDVQDLYGPMLGIPTTIVIARDGTLCRRHVGLSTRDAFEREIKSLL